MTAEGLRLMEDNDGANVAQKAATAEQVALAKQLCQRVLEVRKDLTKESFSRVLKEKVLGRVGAKRIEDLTRAHCDHLIETLRTTIAKATGEPPEGDGEPEGN